MTLPNGDRAVVSDAKLYGFLLNEHHPAQSGHAALFRRLLGVTKGNAESLRAALLAAATSGDAEAEAATPYGQKYRVRFPMTGERGSYIIRSIWIIETGQQAPRLVTAYVE